ncbi:MAG: FHA domain-containing protein [Gemmataceae bacterium]|nr:FHA domain-containing protein [Gemmataceae bacterium]
MHAKLIESGDAPADKREIPITREEFLIGRGSDCDLRLGSSAISRHHCLIRVRGDEALVLDLGSSNGTFLNGQRVRSQATLHSGDQLRVGSFAFAVELAPHEGISWCPEPDSDPTAATYKLKDMQRLLEEGIPPAPKGGRPPGEAGGQGDQSGKEPR